MKKWKHLLVWLSRIHRCRGFGIQSPSDYSLVRYVINEHWPYYRYDELAWRNDDWLTTKLGRLYFRLANWRQPAVIVTTGYEDYFGAGCQKAQIAKDAEHADIIRMTTDGNCRQAYARILDKVDERSILIVEGIRQNKAFWQQVQQDERTGITMDLYYCGLVLFDKQRTKQNYVVNF